VVLEAPTGCGKSHIAATLARHYGRAYVCTLTKSLQDQYVSEPDFKKCNLKDLKGRKAFHCDRARSTCEVGGILFQGEDACDECPYQIAKNKSLRASICVANYKSFLWNVIWAPKKGGRQDDDGIDYFRDLLVLDEAHELEDVLLDTVSVSIDTDKLHVPFDAPLPTDRDSVPAHFAWLEKLSEHMSERRKDINDPMKLAEHDRLARKIGFTLRFRDREEWIVERGGEEGGRRDTSTSGATASAAASARDRRRASSSGVNIFSLKPITVGSFGHMYFDQADKILLMSGTILNAQAFCDGVGIPLDQAEFIGLPCIFPKENRPIIVGNFDMRKAARFDEDDPSNGSWPSMVKSVEGIMAHHAADKGLILTPSNEMIKYLMKELGSAARSRLIPAFGEEREKRYQEHLSASRPSVLIASGMWSGIDLTGDRSRFQIIPALPRPYLSPQVQARMRLHRWWYSWKTMMQAMQGVGRSIRSESDSAVTYILDREFRVQCERTYGRLVPDWMMEAVQIAGEE